MLSVWLVVIYSGFSPPKKKRETKEKLLHLCVKARFPLFLSDITQRAHHVKLLLHFLKRHAGRNGSGEGGEGQKEVHFKFTFVVSGRKRESIDLWCVGVITPHIICLASLLWFCYFEHNIWLRWKRCSFLTHTQHPSLFVSCIYTDNCRVHVCLL